MCNIIIIALFLGVTKSGFRFERISRRLHTAVSAFMRRKPPIEDIVVNCNIPKVLFPVEVFNYGTLEVLYIRVKALYGDASPKRGAHTIHNNKTINVIYRPPSDRSTCNKLDRIILTAKRRYSDEEFSLSIPVLLSWNK